MSFKQKEKLDKLLAQIDDNMLIDYGKFKSISVISERSFEPLIILTDFDGNTKKVSEDELIKELESLLEHREKKLKRILNEK